MGRSSSQGNHWSSTPMNWEQRADAERLLKRRNESGIMEERRQRANKRGSHFRESCSLSAKSGASGVIASSSVLGLSSS